MKQLDWDKFEDLPGAATRNWEQLCRAVIRRNYASNGSFRSVAQQPGVEFHIKVTKKCEALGDPGRWWGWQCRWYDLKQGEPIGQRRKNKIVDAIRTTEKWLSGMSDWVLWTRRALTPTDQTWFHAIKTPMQLHLHTAEDLSDLMTGDALALRSAYFGELVLTDHKLDDLREEGIAPIEERYDPAVHIKVEAEEIIEQMLGEPTTWKALSWRATRVRRMAKDLRADAKPLTKSDPQRPEIGALLDYAREVEQRLRDVVGQLDGQGAEPARVVASHHFDAAVSRRAVSRMLVRLRARKLPAALGAMALDAELHQSRRQLARLCERVSIDICAVVGGAGLGKSHLAVDVTAAMPGRPAGVYLQGRELTKKGTLNDLLGQILSMPAGKFIDLLEGLDAAGARAGRRLPLVIDGLNEAEDPARWKKLLSHLKVVVRRYPNVLVVLTLRDSAVSDALPTGITQIDLPGFREELDAAIDRYFTHYKIQPGETRLPRRLFIQPLMLRMFCQVANRERKSPVGVAALPASAVAIFDAFRSQAVKRIATEQLGCAESDVARGLHRVALALWEGKTRSLTFDEMREIVDPIPGQWHDSIAKALEDEGVLMRDPGPSYPDQHSGILFDEFAGYLIADAIVTDVGSASIDAWMAAEKNLGLLDRTRGAGHPLAPDIFKALAGVLPRRAFRQLWSYLDGADREAALVWAADLEPTHITSDTVSALEQLMVEGSRRSFDDLLGRLWDVRGDNGHPLNAQFTDRVLRAFELADRDLRWCEWIRRTDQTYFPRQGGVIRRDIDELERRWRGRQTRDIGDRLRALWTTWLLASPDRRLRDRATRALYAYGLYDPQGLFELTISALHTNDPYVPERLLAASYGVAMANQIPRSPSFEVAFGTYLAELADAFLGKSASAPTSHWLTREYALGAWRLAGKLYPDLISALPTDWPTELATVTTPKGVGESTQRGQEIAPTLGMDFENYTVGRLYEDRANYDSDHVRYKAGMAEIRARVWQLGWRRDRFEKVDRDIADDEWRRGRRDDGQRIERYGKKYCLIAFYELAGRLQDKGRLPRHPTTRLSDVDIDPSFPGLPPPVPIDMPKWARTTPTDTRRWVNGGVVTIPDELLRREALAGATGPWVLVEGYLHDGDELAGRRVWGRFQALLVPEQYGSRVVSALDAMNGWSEVRWPQEPGDYYTFAGEIPWSDEFAASLRHDESRPYEDKITIPGLGEIDVELVSHGYSWESYHSEANDAGGLSVPSRLLSDYATLLRVPDGVDHADDDGKPASIATSAPDGFDRGQLLYIREDLLTAYAQLRGREIVITARGERQAAYEITRRRPRWYLNMARSRSDEWKHARHLAQLTG